MRDPQLPSDCFLSDRIVARESIHLQIVEPHEQGVSPGDALLYSGEGGLSILARLSNPDLSRFNTLRLKATNLSEEIVLAGIKLYRCSDRRPEEMSLSGGREILYPGELQNLEFPAECFGTYGTQSDWRNTRKIEFSFTREKDYSGVEPIRVAFHGLEGDSRAIPRGPRLTPIGLSRVLVPDGAAKAVSDVISVVYCESNPGISIPPPHSYAKENADVILSGKIMGQRIGMPIDWRTSPIGSLEWTHFLHRHHFLRALVIALNENGDARYAEALERIMVGWIADNPVPVGSNGGAGPSWETLSVAWRLREWLWIAGATHGFDSFQESARTAIFCSVWEHARSLMDHKGHPNNWIIVESAALALAGLCFSGFVDAAQWMETGIQRLELEFKRQFFSDGVHFEISALYHSICLHAYVEVKEAADVAGVKLPEIFQGPLERCADYLAALCRPDFTWPSLNDSGSADMDYTMLMAKAGDIFKRSDLKWLGSRGAKGEVPEPGLKVFAQAGIAAMRSGFRGDANFLVFRAGPPGAAHMHEDVLSMDLTALGEPRLVDPGITTYGPGPLTAHYRKASAHNTILIDGQGPKRLEMSFADRTKPAGGDLSYQIGDDFLAVTGACRWLTKGPAASCQVVRTVVFVGSRYWVVRDHISGEGLHEISVCWQFAPQRCEADPASLGVRSFGPDESEFLLVPCLGTMTPELRSWTGSLNPTAGWVSMQGKDMPALFCMHTLKAQLPVTLLWFLWPSETISSTPKFERRAVRKNAETLDLWFAGGAHHIMEFMPPLGGGPGSVSLRMD